VPIPSICPELVARPRRFALMDLCLHGLEPTIKFGEPIRENHIAM